MTWSPLYVETNSERGAAELASEMAALSQTGAKPITGGIPAANAAVGEAQSSVRFGADVPAHLTEEAGPRRSAVITEGRRVSFATYSTPSRRATGAAGPQWSR